MSEKKFRKKKDCHDCRALIANIGWKHMITYKCDLGFIIIERERRIEKRVKTTTPIPRDICPKPRTYAQLDALYVEDSP